MIQHMLLTYIVPPVLLLATPEWLARLVLGRGRAKRVFYFLARPVPAALAFNGVPAVHPRARGGEPSVQNALVHYPVHTGAGGDRVPAVDAGVRPAARAAHLLPGADAVPVRDLDHPDGARPAWLTFAEGSVYSAYDVPARLWGISVTSDQQAAGAIMKLVGGSFLWVVITLRFFQWAAKFSDTDKAVDQAGPAHELHVGRRRARVDRHTAGRRAPPGATAPATGRQPVGSRPGQG